MSEAIDSAARSDDGDNESTPELIASLMDMQNCREGALDRYFVLRDACDRDAWRAAIAAFLRGRDDHSLS